MRVWEWDGQRSWIDCRTAGGVFNLGHRPPAIIQALRQGCGEKHHRRLRWLPD